MSVPGPTPGLADPGGPTSGTLHQGGADTIGFDPAAVTGPVVLGRTQLVLSLLASTAAVTLDSGDPG